MRRCGALPCGSAEKPRRHLPESLNHDGAEEDEEGGEEQRQEGHHFPPETKATA